MKARILKTESEYETVLKRIDVLMEAEPGTPEENELDVLCMLVERYEQEHYPIGMPSPVAAIEFFMDQNELTKADMVQYLGSPSKVSEVLNGKRSLSKTMIRKLVEGLGIPAEILLEVNPLPKTTYRSQLPAKFCVAEGAVPYGTKHGIK